MPDRTPAAHELAPVGKKFFGFRWKALTGGNISPVPIKGGSREISVKGFFVAHDFGVRLS